MKRKRETCNTTNYEYILAVCHRMVIVITIIMKSQDEVALCDKGRVINVTWDRLSKAIACLVYCPINGKLHKKTRRREKITQTDEVDGRDSF